MNKSSKILLTFVIILLIALITMTVLFFKMKNLAYYNYSMYESQKDLSNFLEKQLEEYRKESGYLDHISKMEK